MVRHQQLQHVTRAGVSYIEIAGVIHVHTRYSDGGCEFPVVVRTCQQLGLDFAVVTDHMTLAGREAGYDGRHGDVLVVVGYEHNDPANKNHYLALGTNAVFDRSARPQNYIDYVKAERGVGFIAHPFEKRNYFESLPSYPWTDWSVDGYDGIEVWNQMSDWVENLRLGVSIIRLVYPRRLLGGITEECLVKWDSVNRRRFVSGIGGVDAHSKVIRFGLLRYKVFPLKVELQGIRTHLYVPEAFRTADNDAARGILFEALRDGRGFISNYRWGDARGTQLRLHHSNGTVMPPGRTEAPGSLPCELRVALPAPARVVLLRNGIAEAASSGQVHAFVIAQPGVYRIEAHRKGHAWIYSNPFPIGAYPF